MNTIFQIIILLTFSAITWAGPTPDEDSIVSDINKEIAAKKIDLGRWKAIGPKLKDLKIGMTREKVVELLGEADPYPKDQKTFSQYSPSPFHGGEDGPDWSLLIYFKDDKIAGFKFRKFVYGPPPAKS